MKYLIPIIISLVALSEISQSQEKIQSGCLDCYNFVAPTILGAENLNPAEVGLIVYDSYYNMFRGYTNSGVWSKLSSEKAVRTISSGQTLTSTDEVVLVNAASGNLTIVLPPANTVGGREIIIKKTDSSLNLVTIDATSTETIDGAAIKLLSTFNESLRVLSDGSNWQILQRNIPSEWQSFTPTWTATTTNPTIGNGTLTGKWRRIGDSMDIVMAVTLGSTSTIGSGSYAFGIPSGFIIDYNKSVVTSVTNKPAVGEGSFYDSSNAANAREGFVFDSSTTAFRIYLHGAGTVGSGVTGMGGSGDELIIRAKVPIVGWEG